MSALTLNDIGFEDRIFNTGSSKSSNHLAELIKLSLNHYEEPVSLQRKSRSLASLQDFFNEHSTENWDGYGALPLSNDALADCKEFLKNIPADVSFPDLIPEPSGGIGFQWKKSKDWVFIVSFKGNNILSYAGIFGAGNKNHGQHIFRNSIPKIILENIKRIIV
ncbi:hypothetical protein [Sulfuriflexus mobilis]|uniref:hypothetical protein n=1 Tax=Sulfuriflexus mobilis TaxID=1811807 RepID=UPI000F83BB29|nr:hypothetical protein [Sulfuriflexus mobilis]